VQKRWLLRKQNRYKKQDGEVKINVRNANKEQVGRQRLLSGGRESDKTMGGLSTRIVNPKEESKV
jgi:hypothetical protein